MNCYNGLSRYQQEKIMRMFCADVTATQAALLTDLNRKTINRYFHSFRERIFAWQEAEKSAFFGTVEVDESFFGPSRVRGRPGPRKRGRGTTKQPVFGVFERGGRVYTEIVPDCSRAPLQAIIRGRVSPESILHSDGWRGYNGLVDVGYDRHFRINKTKTFAENGVHINGIESFWSFTKRRLAKFNGCKKNFQLHLKECEWRWDKDFDTLRQELKRVISKMTV